MAKTPFKAQQDLIDERAKERAAAIDRVGNEIFSLLVANDMSVNDAKVVFNMLLQDLTLVFDSRSIKEFMPEPEKGAK